MLKESQPWRSHCLWNFWPFKTFQILPLRAWSVLGVCQVWPWWNFHMPEVFWSAIGKKSSFWNAFCLAVVALSKIPMKLVYWKQHYERWKAKPSCLHCLSISVRLKEVARPSWFSLRTNTFFFSSAMLVLWLMLFFFFGFYLRGLKSCKYWEWDKENGICDGNVQWAISGPCCHCYLHSSKF